jgi:hypothetical protein
MYIILTMSNELHKINLSAIATANEKGGWDQIF